jgi:Transposase DDE domain
MQSTFANALSSLVSQHSSLSPSRRETLAWLVLLITRFGSVCLWRLAAHMESRAELASVRRRISRFFQYVQLDAGTAARLVVSLLGLDGKPWVLAIDRTNWRFGRTSINILMIAVEWNGMGIPLMWSLLPKEGNSSTAERTALLDRLAEAFPDIEVAALTGDREFIGQAWMRRLAEHRIPFDLRLRENQIVQREGHVPMPISTIAQGLRPGQTLILKAPCRLGAAAPAVRLVIRRLDSGELLAIATSGKPRFALQRYRRRWRIETLFANLKSKGFNLEDTHITEPARLSTLIAILAIAVALAAKSGVLAATKKPIPVKAHGRPAASLFAHGRAAFCKLLASPHRHDIPRLIVQLLGIKPNHPAYKSCQV